MWQRHTFPLSISTAKLTHVSVGTGKTATFAIGILQSLDVQNKECQALVLAPTRELAQQILRVTNSLGDFMAVKVHAFVGGTSRRDGKRCLSFFLPPSHWSFKMILRHSQPSEWSARGGGDPWSSQRHYK